MTDEGSILTYGLSGCSIRRKGEHLTYNIIPCLAEGCGFLQDWLRYLRLAVVKWLEGEDASESDDGPRRFEVCE
jgi:hypothetical protein